MTKNYNAKDIKVIAPLFDRMIDLEPSIPSEAKPYSGLNLEELKASIQREVSYILNTRESKIPFSFHALNEDQLIDQDSYFGLPDFSSYDVTEIEGSRKLAHHLKYIIENYEPRLMDVRVAILNYDNSTQSLFVSINGDIRGILLTERFTFPINIEHIGGK